MKIIVCLIIFSFVTFSYAQQSINPDEKIPLDSSVSFGKLSNGLTYYVKENKKPEHRAYLRLIVNAGSVLENDNQQGLAHFVEHMAFNGTKNFKKHEIIDYFESIGMKFGPEINAYTSFDQTVYMIEVPTDSTNALEKGIDILKEWAHNVSFENDEIDKERGVIIEEWRTHLGAETRIFNKQFPVLLKNSRYAERIVIGKPKIIKNCSYSTLKQFYKDWYRPDLMAVIAVGDFDKTKIVNEIKKYFSRIPNPVNERPRTYYPVPNTKGTLYSIVTDPEMSHTFIRVYDKMDVEHVNNIKEYKQWLTENLYNRMLNNRFTELSQKPDPPFIYAWAYNGRLVKSKDGFILNCAVKENGIKQGLETILTEEERVKEFGFTKTELAREKKVLLSHVEQEYNERDKTESSKLINEYVSNFLYGMPAPGISYEYKKMKEILPEINLTDVNSLSNKYLNKNNRVILVGAPEKKDVPVPTKKDLEAVVAKVSQLKLTPYEDKVSSLPLVEKIPEGSKIIEEKKLKEINAIELKLANGAKVILKKTDFKNDEVKFRAFSPGGTSLVPDSEFIPAETASSLVYMGGLGNFNLIELKKELAGKVVNLTPFIGELYEGLNGSASPKDIKTLFQLIYLYFTSPRSDSTAFLSYQSRLKSYFANRELNPNSAFQDTLQLTLGQYNLRRYPLTESSFSKMDLNESVNIYKDRFADASDFTFVFVGNFDMEKIKPLIETYIGGLPSINRNENWKDLKIKPPTGVISKKVIKGIEDKSIVDLTFTGPFVWNFQNSFDLKSMCDVLRIKLREIIREEKSGTYGVGVYGYGSKIPEQLYNISIRFECSPKRVDELVDDVMQTIDSLKTIPVDDIYLTKVRETQLRQREVNLKNNNYWLNTIQNYLFEKLDFSELNDVTDRIKHLSKDAIMKSAEKYFNMKNYVKVVLYPKKS